MKNKYTIRTLVIVYIVAKTCTRYALHDCLFHGRFCKQRGYSAYL